MGIFDSIGKSFKSLGKKIGAGAQFLGKKTLVGLDYTIQGAKIATAGSAKGELEGLKDGYKIFNEARGGGQSLLKAGRASGSRVLKGYGIHKDDFKEMATASKNTLNMARRGNLQAIVKTGAYTTAGGVVGAGVMVEPPKEQAPAQAQQKKIQPQQPRVLQPKPKPIIHAPPLTKEPINLEFRDNGIYQYGKLVG